MMKTNMDVLYVWPRSDENQAASGELKKGYAQIEALKKWGLKSQLLCINTFRKHYKILSRLPFFEIYNPKIRAEICSCITNELRAVYIRKLVCDKSFIKLLKDIRLKKPDVKLIYEIPTYPYDAEWSAPVRWPILIKDRIHRKRLSRYLNRIVTVSNDQTIFNTRCISIDNGISCDQIVRRTADRISHENLRLIGVAWVQTWHGYDRVIRGLGEYYKSNPDRAVEFHIVGEGNVVGGLKKLCREWNVEQYVFFHGWMHGKELDDMFDQCDIGVGSLGMYRIGLQSGNTLKLREYTARGIPFFYGYTDLLIQSCVSKYTLQISNDDSPVDINKIIEFYEKVQGIGFDTVATEMRRLAEENLSWTKQMKPVADYILSGDSGEKEDQRIECKGQNANETEITR